MKKYLLILFVPLAFWACSKTNEVVTPDIATPLVGVYNQNYYRFDTTAANNAVAILVDASLPATLSGGGTYSASFTVRRDSASVIYVTLLEKQTGSTDQTSIVGQLKVKGTTPPYDLLTTKNTFIPIGYSISALAAGTKVGTCDGTNLNFEYTLPYGKGYKWHEIYTCRK